MATVIEAAGNLVFALIVNSIRELYLEHLERFRPIVARRDELATPLCAAAIAAGDAARARAAMTPLATAKRRGCSRRSREAGDARRDSLVIAPREASIFAALADAVAAPEPPLPPVAATDAVARSTPGWPPRPPRNRVGAARRAARARAARPAGAASGRSTARGRLARARPPRALARPAVPQLAEALRAAAAVSYYGDARVMAALGYDAAARVREAVPAAPRAQRRAGGARAARRADPTCAPARTGRATLRADVCIVGAGAGGAAVATSWPRPARASSCSRRAGDHPAASSPPARAT